jgi:hypothetical protein
MRGEPLVIAIHRDNAPSTHYSVTEHGFLGNGFSTCIDNRCTTILLRVPQRLHSPVERLENALAIAFKQREQLVRRRNVEVGRTFHCTLFFTSEIKVFRYL